MKIDLREKTSTLVLAAGDGTRLGGQPKALVEVGGKSLVEHVFNSVSEISSQVIVGVRATDVARVSALLGGLATVTAGGATRQETVQILLALADREMVMIHDVARPFTTEALYRSVLQAAFKFGAATPVLPVSTSDSIAISEGDWLGDPLPRDRVVRTQTPYSFNRVSLLRAMHLAKINRWEDTTITALVTRAGNKVRIVPGDANNFKITYPEDLEEARARFARSA